MHPPITHQPKVGARGYRYTIFKEWRKGQRMMGEWRCLEAQHCSRSGAGWSWGLHRRLYRWLNEVEIDSQATPAKCLADAADDIA